MTIVVLAALYTAILCLLNTSGLRTSNTTVAIVDGAILAAALLLALKHPPRWISILLAATAANFLVLLLISGSFEPKAVRDPLVLLAFALLGWRYGGLERARAAFFIVSGLVLTIGVIEFLAPAAYTSVFNVIDFYSARGMIDAETIDRLDSDFFVSGARQDGRVLLPFLGDHRVSSIFLEPVSMGNFGALAFLFALSMDRTHWRTAALAALVGAATIVLSDARFGSAVVLLFIVARLLPLSWMRIALPLMPLVAIALLMVLAASDVGAGDDLPTRLAISGRVLLQMDPSSLFGLSNYEVTTFDAGYAYAFSAFGLPFCVLLWVAFIMAPARSLIAQRYKILLGVYICALLCISGTSLFALKTAGLAFYVAGALAAMRVAPAPAPRPAATRTLAGATA